jgi:tetratricopeptide (TPR) repeat protein
MKKATNRSGRENRAADGVRAATRTASPAGLLVESSRQLEAFDEAMRAFHAGKYAPALELFQRAESGPGREVAHSARLHARMCVQRMVKPDLSLQTPDDHYNYAVALINERRLDQAEKHLLLAMAQAPGGDHLFYALALCRGLAGDMEGAYANMKRAMELQPRNKAIARNDPDFTDIGQRPPLARLLYPERV